MRRLLLVAFSLTSLVAASPATAQLPGAPAPEAPGQQAPQQQTSSLADEAARALQTNPVYVHPDAEEGLTRQQADDLRRRITDQEAGPLYIAVLPQRVVDEAGGSAQQALVAIANQVRRTGVYAIVAGDQFYAAASRRDVFGTGDVPRMADDALEANGSQGSYGIVTDFVDRVGQARRNGGQVPGDNAPRGGGFGGLGLLALLLGGFGLFSLARRRRRRREEEAQTEELRENARDDLVALGDDVRALDLDVQMPNADPRAKEELATALQRYEEADRGLREARHPDDFAPIGEALEQGRYALAAAKAHLEGREPPEHRPPCFFDPRHGPSTRDVEWAPEGYGAPRPVPVCEADAVRLEQGQEPMTREIVAGGRRMPMYDAPAYFSPYAGGYFGGFTGFLPGLLFGSMLGGMFSPGIGSAYGGGFGGDFGGGGDLGGSGWGGLGDVGGGDFGGGDFGGGDF